MTRRVEGANMNRLMSVLGLLMLCALSASDVSAEQYPGVNCKYYGKQGSDSFFDPNGYAANGLKNTSTSARFAVCPLVAPAKAIDRIEVRISTSVDVCKLYQKNNQDLSQTVHTRSRYSGNPQLGIWWHTFDLNQTGSYLANTTYTLFCEIPAGDHIRSYALFETFVP
jgi:hypothetical protein